MGSKSLSHLDANGSAKMVDVGEKKITHRFARAQAEIQLNNSTIQLIEEGLVKKGDVLTVAQVAGIMAAKQTSSLIPLCHPIILDNVNVSFVVDKEKGKILIHSEVGAAEKTGVEMEALTAVSIAALTIYDMVKSVEKGAVIGNIFLVEKKGGKSGDFSRD